MTRINGFIMIGICLITFSCNKNKQVIAFISDKQKIDSLKLEVIKGNINAYEELKVQFTDRHPSEIMFWAIYMSKEFKYKKANIDVVDSYLGEGKRFELLEIESQIWIKKWLEEAVAENVYIANEYLISLEQSLIEYKKRDDINEDGNEPR